MVCIYPYTYRYINEFYSSTFVMVCENDNDVDEKPMNKKRKKNFLQYIYIFNEKSKK